MLKFEKWTFDKNDPQAFKCGSSLPGWLKKNNSENENDNNRDDGNRSYQKIGEIRFNSVKIRENDIR